MADEARRAAIARYQSALLQIRKQEASIATLHSELREQGRQFRKSEEDIKALQSIGQIIAEVLKHLGGDKYIVKASNGPRYIVGCRDKVRRRRRERARPPTRPRRPRRPPPLHTHSPAPAPLLLLLLCSWTGPSSSLAAA